jgi:hypothetical protein
MVKYKMALLQREREKKLYQEIEDELNRIEADIRQEPSRKYTQHHSKNDPKKTYAPRGFVDRSQMVNYGNQLYDSYDYNREERDPKPEKKSVCAKYMGVLQENCTIMFGGKRRKSIKKVKKSGKKVKKSGKKVKKSVKRKSVKKTK